MKGIVRFWEEQQSFLFGEAIKYLKRGMKVARKGWNGKNQYIELASGIGYVNPNGELINPDHEAIGNKAIAFVGTSGVQLGWLASQRGYVGGRLGVYGGKSWEIKNF